MDQKETKTHLKEKYDFTCCICSKELQAAPSLFMQTGMMNSGHGVCPKCKTFLHLEIYPNLKGERMISVEWNAYLKKASIISSFLEEHKQ